MKNFGTKVHVKLKKEILFVGEKTTKLALMTHYIQHNGIYTTLNVAMVGRMNGKTSAKFARRNDDACFL